MSDDPSYLGNANSALNIYRGATSGNPMGQARAGAQAARLYGNLSNNPGISQGALGALNALNLYGGIKQGGVAGDTRAALSAAQLGGQAATAAGASGLGTTLAAAGPISLALAPALIGMSTPAVQLTGQYYNRLGDTLNKGPGAYYNSQDPTQYGKYWGTALQMATSGDPEEQYMLQQRGIRPTAPITTQNTPQWAIRDLNPMGLHEYNAVRPGMKKAKGGNVKNSPVRSKLKALYERSFTDRNYDDGGSVDYFTPTNYTPDFQLQDPYNSELSTLDNPADTSPLANSVYGQDNFVNAQNDPYAYSGSSSGSGALGTLGSLLQKYGALLPLASAAFGGNKPASAPATPSGYGAIPSIATPSYSRPYTQPNIQNWYTYGQGPEQSFFGNNQLPTIPGVSPGNAQQPGQGQMSTPQTPTGGSASAAASPFGPNAVPASAYGLYPLAPGNRPILRAEGGPAFNSQQGDDYVPDPGHGDGTSDDIDAKLSGGEYVMDAGTVSMLGNGSNEAGARALDQLRQRVRQHAGKHLVKGKQFMKAKPPEAYLRGGKK